jgi:hypothetical protein
LRAASSEAILARDDELSIVQRGRLGALDAAETRMMAPQTLDGLWLASAKRLEQRSCLPPIELE